MSSPASKVSTRDIAFAVLDGYTTKQEIVGYITACLDGQACERDIKRKIDLSLHEGWIENGKRGAYKLSPGSLLLRYGKKVDRGGSQVFTQAKFNQGI